jgi:hypothetical protein
MRGRKTACSLLEVGPERRAFTNIFGGDRA